MFGTILDKLQTAFASLFSTSFLLGNFFPAFIFAIVNFVLAWAGIDGFPDWVSKSISGTSAAEGASAFLLLVILAILLGPLVPLLRSLLEGAILPSWLRQSGKAVWLGVRHEFEERENAAKAEFAYFDRNIDHLKETLRSARDEGAALNAITDPQSIKAAADAVSRISIQIQRAKLPERTMFDPAIEAIAHALRKNAANLRPPDPDAKSSEKLDRIHVEIVKLVDLAKDLASRNLGLAVYRLHSSFVPNEIWPTRVGNARAVIERYPNAAYNVSYDFLWPRLRIVLVKDSDMAGIVDTANAKLEFAVLMTWLSAATVAFWLPTLALTGHSIGLYYAVGILGPAAVLFFYLLVDETQKAFGHIISMTVDALHFQLLAALHQPTPCSLFKERETWMQLERALFAEGGVDLKYDHSKAQ